MNIKVAAFKVSEKSINMVLSKKRITKALTSLRGCAGWSAHLLFANPKRQVFSRRGPEFLNLFCYTRNAVMQRISWWVNEHQVRMNTTNHMEIHTMSMDHFSVDNVVLPPAVMPIYAVSPKHFLQIKAQNNICTIGVHPFYSVRIFT